MNAIFETLKKLIAAYAPSMEVRTDTASDYHLYIVKDFEMAGRKFHECYFSGAKVNRSMVSFYFFPYYTNPESFTIPESIKKNLKGKNCFNFKKLDEEQAKDVDLLLKQGFALYNQRFFLS